MLGFIYPAYNPVYLRLDASHQTMFIFVLPLLKLVLQNILAWSTKHIGEYMPGVTIFSVELFNSLYLAKCMQSAGSTTTFIMIVALDVVKSILTYRSMKKRALNIYQLMAHTNRNNRFLDTLMSLCQDPNAISKAGSQIRILSPITLTRRPSLTNSEILHALVRRQSFDWTPCNPSQGATCESSGGSKITRNDLNNARSLSSLHFQLPGQDATLFFERDIIEGLKSNTARSPSGIRRQSIDNVRHTETKQQPLFMMEYIHNKVHPSVKAMNESYAHKISTGRSRFIQPRTCSTLTTDRNLPAVITDSNYVQIKRKSRCISGLKAAVMNPTFVRRATILPFKYRFGKIMPLIRKCKQTPTPVHSFTTCEKPEIIDQSLKLLFQCEYHALAIQQTRLSETMRT